MIYLSTGYIDKDERIAFPLFRYDIEVYPIYFDSTDALSDVDCTESGQQSDYNYENIQTNDIVLNLNTIYSHFKTFQNPNDYTITSDKTDTYNELYDDIIHLIAVIEKKNAVYIGRIGTQVDIQRIVPFATLTVIQKNGFIVTAFLDKFLKKENNAYKLNSRTCHNWFYNFYSDNTQKYSETYIRFLHNISGLKIHERVFSLIFEPQKSPAFILGFDSTVENPQYAYRLPQGDTTGKWILNESQKAELTETQETTTSDGTLWRVSTDYTFLLVDFSNEGHLRRFTNGSSWMDFTEFGVAQILFRLYMLKKLDLFANGDDEDFKNYFLFMPGYSTSSVFYDMVYATYQDILSDFSHSSVLKFGGKYIIDHNTNVDIKYNQQNLRNQFVEIPLDTTIDKTDLVVDNTLKLTLVFPDITTLAETILNTYKSLLHIVYDINFDDDVLVLSVLSYRGVGSNALEITYEIVSVNETWKLGIPNSYEFPLHSKIIYYKCNLFGFFNIINIYNAKYSRRYIPCIQWGFEQING